ncbi:MAG: bifunctional methylenetetrahydrofolate dehydrogenase/methenyltetrahydrofolate cyclohydrolase FolD [Sandaracinaceae bacterium]|nr:bifunctional methylenetetrahydrofolate dehydrogenase/methenyltetrahydrofolate cyclohydrolase FolD [Sandaracinaceae bacterium]
MTAKIIDGKEIAARVRAEVKRDADAFAKKHGRAPGLDVVLVGEDPASQVYVRNKEKASLECGMRGTVHRLPADTQQAVLVALVQKLSADDTVDGILVQLPLPGRLDSAQVIAAIDPGKDVDGLHPVNAGALASGNSGLRPCTPSGCMRMLEEIGYDLNGKKAVVIGRSNLVGKPIALMLLEKNATVTIAHSRTADLPAVVRDADVVIAAVGKSRMVKADWIKPGAVVIDVGINRGADGKLSGDVDFDEVSRVASHLTPVPGGVGAMTIAMLLRNAVDAAMTRAS